EGDSSVNRFRPRPIFLPICDLCDLPAPFHIAVSQRPSSSPFTVSLPHRRSPSPLPSCHSSSRSLSPVPVSQGRNRVRRQVLLCNPGLTPDSAVAPDRPIVEEWFLHTIVVISHNIVSIYCCILFAFMLSESIAPITANIVHRVCITTWYCVSNYNC
ncbi:uncharacterized protein LOC110038191, partial [Phalaenopsis equestris]|uniref:uncharacterized protein LOC110038191 n=1 Tax=Phalaenopsis equestris TaxID=78828 RepID=UPI0009E44695